MTLKGQSLIEYTFAIAAIGGFVVTSLFFLGSTTKTMFDQTLTFAEKPAPSQTGGPSPSDSGKSTLVAGLGTSPGAKPGEGTKTVILKLNDGTLLTIPGYPVDLADAIETSGGSGVTYDLGKQLSALADQLMRDGKITQKQLYALKDLAACIYGVGELESMLEKIYREDCSGDVQCYVNQTVSKQLGGASLTDSATAPIYLSSLMDGVGGSVSNYKTSLYNQIAVDYSSTLETDSPPIEKTTELQVYYYRALKSGALEDPVVKAFVIDQVSRVHKIMNIVASTPPDPQKLATYAQETNDHGTNVCTVGKGTPDEVSGRMECQ